MSDPARPVTLVTTRLVRAGHEKEFDLWADRFDAAAARCPGTNGTLRLDEATGMRHFVHRFPSKRDLEQWLDGRDYRALAEEADAYSVGREQVTEGDRRHARLPSEAAVPKWKMWLATWITVFPLLLALNAGIKAVAGGLPQPVQLGITSLIMTAALTWFILPQVRRLIRPWLFADADGQLRRDAG